MASGASKRATNQHTLVAASKSKNTRIAFHLKNQQQYRNKKRRRRSRRREKKKPVAKHTFGLVTIFSLVHSLCLRFLFLHTNCRKSISLDMICMYLLQRICELPYVYLRKDLSCNRPFHYH